MQFSERSYGGKLFRPTPEIYFENDLLIIATPWGPRNSAKKAIQIISDYYTSARNDVEVTAPFEKLTCLSSLANILRIAGLLANNTIHRDENKSEYVSGIELFIGAQIHNEFVWLQLGQPNILLSRNGHTLIPLGSTTDLSTDFSQSNEILPPLPSGLLGLDSNCNFVINSFRPQTKDRLFLISRSILPGDLFILSDKQLTTNEISRTLARQQSEMPFWIGALNL